MHSSLADLLHAAASRFGNKTALIVDQESLSFHALEQRCARFARALQDLGINQGDRVSLLASNSIDWVVAYYGVIQSGAIVNPLNMGFDTEQAFDAINDCGAVAVISSTAALSALDKRGTPEAVRHLISLDGPGAPPMLSFSGMIDDAGPGYREADAGLDDVAAICYTSGTTAHPKGAVLSHRALLMNASLCATVHARDDRDIAVTALPCFHVYGAMVLNAAITCGMTLVLHAQFDPDAVLKSIEQHRATLFEGMPIMFLLMLQSERQAEFDLSSLRRCTVGGQTLSLTNIALIEKRFGCPLLEIWGQTEVGGVGTSSTYYGPHKPGSIGVGLPHVETRIGARDDYRCALPAHQVGELLIRTRMAMQGYFNAPELTSRTIEQDGWLHTGDLAYMDEDGFIFIVDRLVDMIMHGGRCVYPTEVEHVIDAHPQVALVGVVGVVDAVHGQQVKAFVVVNANAGPLDLSELRHFCAQHLDDYKIPVEIEVVDSLPMTPTGKVKRRALRDLAAT